MALLRVPIERQVDTPDQLRGIEIDRLDTLADRLDDFRREESQRQYAADISIVDPFAPGEFGDRGFPGEQVIETAICSTDLLEQRRICLRCCRMIACNDEPHFDTTSLGLERDVSCEFFVDAGKGLQRD